MTEYNIKQAEFDEQENNVSNPLKSYYYIGCLLRGRSNGCAQQVNQAVAVETSHGVTTEAIKACNDLKGTVKLEGACDKKVSSSLFTPDGSPQNIDEVERKGRS
ncbi:hypothetical protein [Wolbachia endosymbiont (group E) of Neria commutata]|uniref:hypothetical protein n=1 Tax=Wolbachia endosymbiont (group E) of Neria commutata TaxID=3066149 RepID=UPI0031334D53